MTSRPTALGSTLSTMYRTSQEDKAEGLEVSRPRSVGGIDCVEVSIQDDDADLSVPPGHLGDDRRGDGVLAADEYRDRPLGDEGEAVPDRLPGVGGIGPQVEVSEICEVDVPKVYSVPVNVSLEVVRRPPNGVRTLPGSGPKGGGGIERRPHDQKLRHPGVGVGVRKIGYVEHPD